MESLAAIKISRRKLKSLIADNAKSAEAINLVYVNDTEPGIRRKRRGNTFTYVLNNKPVKDKETISRIRSLVIPPAWTDVWICNAENGHLQATGYDVKHRKQYRYHPMWHELRSKTKFYHLYEFGKVLPAVRTRLAHDLVLPGMPQAKVLAAIVSIMQQTGIRIGNSEYEKLYGSFGLSTLKNKHVQVNGSNVRFAFRGKKGVYQDISLQSKKLANIIKKCLDLPGKELFQYYDEDGSCHSVDSGMVNTYIKEISNGNFTAKDFRTWTGTLHALLAFCEIGECETVTETKKNIVAVLDKVSLVLGNTRTVCKKYYVHPALINHYEEKKLGRYLKMLDETSSLQDADLHPEEEVLMKILAAA